MNFIFQHERTFNASFLSHISAFRYNTRLSLQYILSRYKGEKWAISAAAGGREGRVSHNKNAFPHEPHSQYILRRLYYAFNKDAVVVSNSIWLQKHSFPLIFIHNKAKTNAYAWTLKMKNVYRLLHVEQRDCATRRAGMSTTTCTWFISIYMYTQSVTGLFD